MHASCCSLVPRAGGICLDLFEILAPKRCNSICCACCTSRDNVRQVCQRWWKHMGDIMPRWPVTHVTRLTSHVTRHTSHVTRHTSLSLQQSRCQPRIAASETGVSHGLTRPFNATGSLQQQEQEQKQQQQHTNKHARASCPNNLTTINSKILIHKLHQLPPPPRAALAPPPIKFQIETTHRVCARVPSRTRHILCSFE